MIYSTMKEAFTTQDVEHGLKKVIKTQFTKM